jgi:excinuclease ABC subunit A
LDRLWGYRQRKTRQRKHQTAMHHGENVMILDQDTNMKFGFFSRNLMCITGISYQSRATYFLSTHKRRLWPLQGLGTVKSTSKKIIPNPKLSIRWFCSFGREYKSSWMFKQLNHWWKIWLQIDVC